MRYFIKPLLISLILILTYKAHASDFNKAHASDFNLDACKKALLGDTTRFLHQTYEAIEQDNLGHLLEDQGYLEKAYEELHNNGNSLLYYASLLGEPDSIEAIVSELNVDVNTEDSNKRTALHYAALNKNIFSRFDTIYILIKLGIDPETTDNLGNLPSFYLKEREKKISYREKQRLKGAELALPPYNIDRRYLAKLFQVSFSTLNSWIKNKATEMLKQGILASEISSITLIPEYEILRLFHPESRDNRGTKDLTHNSRIERAVARVLKDNEPIEQVAESSSFTEDYLKMKVTEARYR